MSKERILQFIIPIFFALVILKHYSAALSAIATSMYISIGYLALILSFTDKRINPRIVKWTFFIMLIGLLNGLISLLVSTNYRLQDFLLLFCYMGIAIIPFSIKLDYRIYTWFHIFLIIFFCLHTIKGATPDEIFLISRNLISVLLLITTSYYIISAHQNNKKISLVLLTSSLILAIWATGRSGIIVFTILLISVIFFAPQYKKYRLIYVILFFTGVFFVYMYFFTDLLSSGLSRFVNYGIEDNARSDANLTYLSTIKENFIYLLVGAPLKEIAPIVELKLNPHNSIIRLHVYYGLVGPLMLSYLFLRTIFFFIKKRHFIYLSLLGCLLIRSSVDSIAFHGPLDPLIYYLLFQFIEKANNYDILAKSNPLTTDS